MPLSTSKITAIGDQQIAFPASWDLYQALAHAIGDRPIRVAFDGERVQLSTPGPRHERDWVRLERLVWILAEVRRLPCKSMGSTRWERPEAWHAPEADATFYLTRPKVEAARIRSPEIADYPSPDLAIEIDHRRPQIDRASIYAVLGVPEVWLHDGDEVTIHRLGDEGAYHPVDRSPLLAIGATDLGPWMEAEEADDIRWSSDFRAWISAQPFA